MGFRQVGEEGNRLRFESAAEGAGTVVDLRRVPGFWAGADGRGHRAPRGLPRRLGRRPSSSSARGSRRPAWTSRRSWTGSTSARSTSASRAACCSRSRPTRRGSRSTSRRPSWGRSSGCRRCTSRCASGSSAPCRPSGCRTAPRGGGDVMTAHCAGLHPSVRAGHAPGPAAAAAAPRDRRERGRSAAARRAAPARRRAAEPARAGAGERHAAVLPPAGRGRVRPRRPAATRRTSWPNSWTAARRTYDLGPSPPVAVGFSNGANIAAAHAAASARARSAARCCSGRWCRWCPTRCPRSGACRSRSTPARRIRSSRRRRARRWASCSGARAPIGVARLDSGGHGLTPPDLEVGARFLSGYRERGSLNRPRSVFVLFRGCSAHRNGTTLPRSRGSPGVWRRPLSLPPAGASSAGPSS